MKHFFKASLLLLALQATALWAAPDKMIDCIPENCDGAVIFRCEALQKNHALQVIAEAGDVKRYKRDLDWIRCNSKAPYPDMLIVLWGDDYGIIVSGLPEFKDNVKKLKHYYEPIKGEETYEIQTGAHTGYDYISILRHRRDKIKRYDLVYLGPDTAMLMGGRHELPWDRLTTSFNTEGAKALAGATENDLIYGYLWRPVKIADPLGLTRLLNNLLFQIRSSDDLEDIKLFAQARCANSRNASSVKNQLQGMGKILLMSMFGNSPELLTMLDKAITFTADKNVVTMNAFISKENMQQLRQVYEKNPDMLKKQAGEK